MKRGDETKIVHIEDGKGNGTVRFLIEMKIGPNRVVDTRLRILKEGDAVFEPGSEHREDRRGTALYQDTATGKVAWVLEDGTPVITDRHRLVAMTGGYYGDSG